MEDQKHFCTREAKGRMFLEGESGIQQQNLLRGQER